MRKSVILLSTLFIALSFVGCKPKQSAYRQVYEQAKQREIAQNNQSTTAPQVEEEDVIVSKPAQSDVTVRKERFTVMDGEDQSRLQRFSVVVGSFSNPTNARGRKAEVEALGYKALLVENEMGMLRVIASSFPNRDQAVSSRDALRERYPDAWLLELDR